MTDEDWATVLEVFRACRSRRGAKGRNDRIFLEAVHDFCGHTITWRALPAACGNWNSGWKRFWRLSQAGGFEAFFDALAAMSQTAHLVQMLDATVVRAHVSATGAKGGQDGQALGRSRGGFSTKSTSRLIWMDAPSRFTSRKVRPATARNARACSTSDRTSRLARRWVIRAMMPKPIAQPRASAASAR